MEETFNVNTHVNKEQYKQLFNKFLSYHGYMTKLVNKATNDLSGYLVRAEISIDTLIKDDSISSIDLIDKLETKYVAITFIPNNNPNYSPLFLKSVGINKVIIGGERKLKNYIKNKIELTSDSILNYFKSPKDLTKNESKMFEGEGFTYQQFYNYIERFEQKIKNYYKDKNVVIFVISNY